MKSSRELMSDVKWWEDELRARKAKLEEAERTLEARTRELADAERAEEQVKSKKG